MSDRAHRWQGAVLRERYLLGPQRGRGGMGDVLEAVDLHTRHKVAVKVLRPELARERDYLERFRREAEIASWLAHPNIVRVHDAGEDRGAYFLVMELLEGEALGAVMTREGAIDVPRALEITRQTLSALEAAHAAGIIHRDLKPGNLLLVPGATPPEDETVKLVDFGIAKLRESRGFARLTGQGVLVGTPRFTAPEQLRGGAMDERADLFSLGVVLYCVLSGKHPFDAPSDAEIARRIVQADRAPLRVVRPDLPAAVLELVDDAMAVDPADRFPSARHMREAAELAAEAAARGGKTPSSPPTADETRAARRPGSDRPRPRAPQTMLPQGTFDPLRSDTP